MHIKITEVCSRIRDTKECRGKGEKKEGVYQKLHLCKTGCSVVASGFTRQLLERLFDITALQNTVSCNSFN